MSILSQWAQGIDLEWLLNELFIVLASIFAITIHESAHGLAAYWLGDDTAKRMGRISLNPLRHIDILGLVMFAVAKFGWAKPVPIDMRRFKNPKAGMAITALAGPLSNVLLAFICTPLFLLSMFFYYQTGTKLWHWGAELFFYGQMINAGLAVFNIIPIPPLDGSKILALVLPQKAHTFLMKYERYGFIVLAVLLFTGVLDTPLAFLRDGLTSGMDWLAARILSVFISAFS